MEIIKNEALELLEKIYRDLDCIKKDPNPYCEECLEKAKKKICEQHYNYEKLRYIISKGLEGK